MFYYNNEKFKEKHKIIKIAVKKSYKKIFKTFLMNQNH